MPIEMEHAAGTAVDKLKMAEMDARKNALAVAFGWTRDEFDTHLEDVKDFLTANRKVKD